MWGGFVSQLIATGASHRFCLIITAGSLTPHLSSLSLVVNLICKGRKTCKGFSIFCSRSSPPDHMTPCMSDMGCFPFCLVFVRMCPRARELPGVGVSTHHLLGCLGKSPPSFVVCFHHLGYSTITNDHTICNAWLKAHQDPERNVTIKEAIGRVGKGSFQRTENGVSLRTPQKRHTCSSTRWFAALFQETLLQNRIQKKHSADQESM